MDKGTERKREREIEKKKNEKKQVSVKSFSLLWIIRRLANFGRVYVS